MNCTPVGNLYIVQASVRGIHQTFLLNSCVACGFEFGI